MRCLGHTRHVGGRVGVVLGTLLLLVACGHGASRLRTGEIQAAEPGDRRAGRQPKELFVKRALLVSVIRLIWAGPSPRSGG